MKQQFVLLVVCVLLLCFAGCDVAQKTDVKHEEPIKTQAQLWEMAYISRDGLGHSGDLAWYHDGVPIVAETSEASQLDAAIANVLLYYNKRQGIFTPPTEGYTDEQFLKEASKLRAQMGTVVKSDDEAIKAILAIQKNRAKLFVSEMERLPHSSVGGHVAQLVGERRTGFRDLTKVIAATKSVANDYGFDFATIPVEGKEFNVMTILLWSKDLLPIIYDSYSDKAYTVVGCLRDMHAGRDYFIVHDPSALTVKEVPLATLVKESGKFADQLRTFLKNKPLAKIDDAGFLNEKTRNAVPAGVRIVPSSEFEGMNTFVMMDVRYDIVAVKAVLSGKPAIVFR